MLFYLIKQKKKMEESFDVKFRSLVRAYFASMSDEEYQSHAFENLLDSVALNKQVEYVVTAAESSPKVINIDNLNVPFEQQSAKLLAFLFKDLTNNSLRLLYRVSKQVRKKAWDIVSGIVVERDEEDAWKMFLENIENSKIFLYTENPIDTLQAFELAEVSSSEKSPYFSAKFSESGNPIVTIEYLKENYSNDPSILLYKRSLAEKTRSGYVLKGTNLGIGDWEFQIFGGVGVLEHKKAKSYFFRLFDYFFVLLQKFKFKLDSAEKWEQRRSKTFNYTKKVKYERIASLSQSKGLGLEDHADVDGEFDNIDKTLLERYQKARAQKGKGGIIVLLQFDQSSDPSADSLKELYEKKVGKEVKDARFMKSIDYKGNRKDVSVLLFHSQTKTSKREIDEIAKDAKSYYPKAIIIFVPLYKGLRKFERFQTWESSYFDAMTPIRVEEAGLRHVRIDLSATDTNDSLRIMIERLRLLVKHSWLKGLRTFISEECTVEDEDSSHIGRSFWKSRRMLKLNRLEEDVIHKHYKAWEAKYDGVVLRWFVSWVDNQTIGAKPVSMGTSYGIFAHKRGSKIETPRKVFIQIAQEFGLTGRNSTYTLETGNVMNRTDAKWLRDQLEAQIAISMVIDVTRAAYEKATEDAEEVVDDVLEKERQKLTKTIDKLMAQIKSNEEKFKALLIENESLKEASKKYYMEVAQSQTKKKESDVVDVPQPPPPPPSAGVTLMGVMNDTKEAEKTAQDGKKELAIVPEKAETAISRHAGGLLDAIAGFNLTQLKKAEKTKKHEKETTPKEEGGLMGALAAAMKKRRGAMNVDSNERIFQQVKSVLYKISVGEQCISSTGHLKTVKLDKSQIPCLICQKTPTIGECACLVGRFCSDKCMDKNWVSGHSEVCSAISEISVNGGKGNKVTKSPKDIYMEEEIK